MNRAAREQEAPEPAGPRRRPVLEARHAAADLMLSLYAVDRLGDVRRASWYAGACAGFALIISRGSQFAPPGSPERAMIDEAGWILQVMKHRRPRVHWNTLQAVYLNDEHVGAQAWRAALDAFARVGQEFDPVRGPTNPI